MVECPDAERRHLGLRIRRADPPQQRARFGTARRYDTRVARETGSAKAAAGIEQRAQHLFAAFCAERYVLSEASVDWDRRAVGVVTVAAVAVQISERSALDR